MFKQGVLDDVSTIGKSGTTRDIKFYIMAMPYFSDVFRRYVKTT